MKGYSWRPAVLCLLAAFTGCGGGAVSGNSGSQATAPFLPVASLQATPAQVNAGQPVSLTWTTSNAASVAIAPSVSSVSLPASGSATVAPSTTTKYVLTATASSGGTTTATAMVTINPIPLSPIAHLIIVVMQNNSFDHLFGTFPNSVGLELNAASSDQRNAAGAMVHPELQNNLDPADLNHTQASYDAAYDGGKMDMYAQENGVVSMNYFDNSSMGTASDGTQHGVATLWSYAQQYALADNFFASAMASEPSNMLYMTSASVGTGSDPFGYPQLDACSTASLKNDPNPYATVDPPLTFQSVGDQMTANKIPWTWYQENFNTEQDASCVDYVPQENPFQYFSSTANSPNLQTFTMSNFTTVLSSAAPPAVMWIQPAPENSMHPGAANIGNGIEWLDNLIQTVKGSSVWSSTAVVVVWDESGGWYDHVAPPQLANTIGLGARVPVLLISPSAKSNYISHQQMDFVSILRFIQWNWALGQFSDPGQAAREQLSGDLCDLLNVTCSSPQ
jgi:phospholipase C